MKKTLPFAVWKMSLACLFASLLLIYSQDTATAAIMDSINPNAQPASTPIGLSYGFDEIGWYYTPSTSYLLSGIQSKFDVQFTDTGSDKVIAISVYNDRPSLGGSVLSTGSFTLRDDVGFGTTKPFQGAELPSIQLTAGTRYFVAFSDLLGEGVNVSTWRLVNGVPTLTNGATQSLGAYYIGANYGVEVTTQFQTVGNGGRISGTSPILQFTGEISSVPEPSSGIFLLSLFSIPALRKRWLLAQTKFRGEQHKS